MPALKTDGRRIISHGFALWKAKEARDGRRIEIPEVAAATGLAKDTVRRFIAKDRSEVTHVSIVAASMIASYLEVPWQQLLEELDVPN